jgi:HAD superfamily hydrolase (TIGR01509 family)
VVNALPQTGAAPGGSRRYDAVVFDLDGVIVDSERVVYELWQDLFACFGCSFTTEEWISGVGGDRGFSPHDALAERATGAPPRAELQELIEEQSHEILRELGPLPGVVDWVTGAEELEMKVAVASSSPQRWVDARLAEVGLGAHFAVRSCAGGQLAAKPAPDVYLDACSRLGVPLGRAIAVEDSFHGLTAARAAGLACVAVPNQVTSTLDFRGAGLVIGSLATMPLIEAIELLGAL